MSTEWLDRNAYPFESRYIELPAGRMHYIDEGQGTPLVMAHGNPSWSFLYRHPIQDLKNTYRCIAMDHLGFGLSDKPPEWRYWPEDHAENFARLMDRLALDQAVLCVNDWGGPIALSWALDNPDKIKGLVIFNTWMWSGRGDPHFEWFSRLLGSALGRYLIVRRNLFAKTIMKKAFGDASRLTPEVHRHYLKPLATPNDRIGCAVFPKRILGSSDWLAALWERRDRLEHLPALILWGAKDVAFRTKERQRWEDLFTHARTVVFEDCGHFVPEEKPHESATEIRAFLQQSPDAHR